MDEGRLHIIIDGESRLKSVFAEIDKGFQDSSRHAGNLGDAIDSSFERAELSASRLANTVDSLKAKLKGALTIAGATAFVKQVYQVRSYYQDIESSMEVFLGSAEKAAKFTKDLKDYAYYNTFEFSDLAMAAQQLIAYGNEVEKISGKGGILDQLSNIATATKQPLMDLVAAWNKAKNVGFVDAKGMQSWAAKGLVLNDVLKDMGERIDNNRVSFEQLQMAIAHVTEEGQMFGGLMDKMMPNLSMSWGQVQDDLSAMWDEIGQMMQEPMGKAIDFVDKLIQHYKDIARVLGVLISMYGAYKAALVFVNTQKRLEITLSKLSRLNSMLDAAGKAKLSLATYAAAAAQRALNAAIKANPIGLIASAVAGAITGLIALVHKTDEVREEKEALADAIGDVEQAVIDERNEVNSLVSELTNSNTSEDRRREIIKRINEIHPSLVSGLEDEAGGLQAVVDKLALYNEAMAKRQALAKYRDKENDAIQAANDAQVKKVEADAALLDALQKYYNSLDFSKGATAVRYTQYGQHHSSLSAEEFQKQIDDIYFSQELDVAQKALQISNLYHSRSGNGLLEEGMLYNTSQAVLNLRSAYNSATDAYVAWANATEQAGSATEETARQAELLGLTLESSQPTEGEGTKVNDYAEKVQGLTTDILTLEAALVALRNGGDLGDFNTIEEAIAAKQSELSEKMKAYQNLTGQQWGKSNTANKKKAARDALDKTRLDMQNQLADMQLKAMEDSAAKTYKQNEINHQKQLEQLDKQKKETLEHLKTIGASKAVRDEWLQMFEAQRRAIDDNFRDLQRDILLQYADFQQRYDTAAANWDATIEAATDENIKQLTGKQKELALAQMNEEYVKATDASTEAQLAALQRRLDAETDLLSGAEKTAKQLRDKVTLAEFSYNAAVANGTWQQQKDALEAMLAAELALLDENSEEYKIKAARNAERLAEFEVGDIDIYTNLEDATAAADKLYQARLATAKEEGDIAKQQKIQVEYAQALYDINKRFSADFALIYANVDNLTKSQLANAIGLTTAEIEKAIPGTQAYTELLAQLRAQLEKQIEQKGGWGFGAIIKGISGYQKAKSEYDAAIKAGDNKTAQLKEGEMSAFMANYEKGWEQIEDTFSNLGDALESFRDGLGGLGDTLADIGGLFSGIAKNADSLKTAFSSTATTGDHISNIANGTLQLVSMIGTSIANNKKAQEEWNQTVRQCAHEYQMLQLEALDYKQQNVFGVENPYKKALDGAKQYQAAMETLRDKASELGKGQVQTGTKKAVDWKNVGTGAALGTAVGASVGSVIPAIGTAIGAAVGAVVGTIAGLFSTKTVPVFESLAEHYGQLYDENYNLNEQILADYNKMDDATKQLIDNWEEIAQKAREAEEQMRDNFSALAGDVGNQLADSLVQAFRNGDLNAAIDDFHAKMTSTIEDIMEQLVFSATMGAMFDELEERMMSSFGAGGDQDIVDDLIWMEGEYQKRLEQYGQAMSDVQNSLDKLGYDVWKPDEEERKGATKTGITASQDSVDESNARMTTIQGHTYEINDNVKKIRQQHTSMLQMFHALLLHVQGIHKDTSNISSKTDDIQKEVSSLHSDVSKIVTNGITIKR